MARPADPHARSALIAAARAEFVQHGIQKARIEDITAACDLSKGAFYLHFESKEALFAVLVDELRLAFDDVRVRRTNGARAVAEGGGGPDALAAFDAAEDRRLLELLWTWRDVIDVLLTGCQGTPFDGVMWSILDFELDRVRDECDALKHARLVRDDVDPEVVGLVVIGTYLLMARRISKAKQKPDFERLVHSLQNLLNRGLAPASRAVAPAPRAHSASRSTRPATPQKNLTKRSRR